MTANRLTDDDLNVIRHRVLADYVDPDSDDDLMAARSDRCVLLDEVDRLRGLAAGLAAGLGAECGCGTVTLRLNREKP